MAKCCPDCIVVIVLVAAVATRGVDSRVFRYRYFTACPRLVIIVKVGITRLEWRPALVFSLVVVVAIVDVDKLCFPL